MFATPFDSKLKNQKTKIENYTFNCSEKWGSLQYQILQKKIAKCDIAIEKLLKTAIKKDPGKKNLVTESKVHKRVTKNMDINQIAYQYFNGVGLLNIEGVSKKKKESTEDEKINS